MKRQALLGASFIAAIPAIAAVDQPANAAGPPQYNWNGPWAGASADYGSGSSNQTDAGIPCTFFGTCPTGSTGPTGPSLSPAADGSFSTHGAAVGAGLGYDWQMGSWVYGVAGDYSWSGLKGSSSSCGANSPVPHACGTDLESFGTLRASIGYALGANGNWLPFVTGGLALGDIKGWDSLVGSSGTDFRAGWTVGGGVEVGIASNWSLKFEYLYVDLPSAQTFDVIPGVAESVNFKANIFRVGLNLKL